MYYRTLFLPSDAMFKFVDTMCPEFALGAKGMERNEQDVYKSHHVLHVTSPNKKSSARLDGMFWAHPACFVTPLHTT